VCVSTALTIVFGLGLLTPSGATADTVLISSVWGSVLDIEIDGIFDFVVNNMVMKLGTRDQRAITEFDLSVVPDGATIVSATFRAYIFGGSGDTPDIEVYGYAGDGMVTLADGYETAQLQRVFPGVLGEWVNLDMTDLVESLFGVEQWAGLHFRNVTPGTFREFDPSTQGAPMMFVEYDAPTPAEPTTWGRIKTIYEL
jgi:hypothetical protein